MLRTIAADKNYTNKKNVSLFGSGIYIQIEHPLVPGSVVLVWQKWLLLVIVIVWLV